MKKIIFLFLLMFSFVGAYAQHKAILHGIMAHPNIARVEVTSTSSHVFPNFGTGLINKDRSYSIEVSLPGPMFCSVKMFGYDNRRIVHSYVVYIEPGKNIEINFSKNNVFEFAGDFAKENSTIKAFRYKLTLASAKDGILKDPKADDLKSIDVFQKHFADTLKHEKYVASYINTWNKVVGYECDRARMKAWKDKGEKEYRKFLEGLMKENFTSTHVLCTVDWCYYLDNFFAELESMGMLPSTDIKYENRVKWIKNPTVRSEYAWYLLTREINSKKWLTNSIDSMVERYKEYITDEFSKPNLESTLEKYNRIKRDFKDINVGKDAPLFTFEDANGEMVSLKDYRGKYVILDFWNIYCGPCKKQIPYIKEMEEELKKKDVYFMSITCDPHDIKDKWLSFVKKNEMGGVQLIMDNGRYSAILKDYQIWGFPTFVLIDPDGKIVDPFFLFPSDPNFKKVVLKHIDEYNSKKK